MNVFLSPELGHIALIIGSCLAVIQAILPFAGSYTGTFQWMQMGRSLAFGNLFFIFFAFLCLSNAFLSDDFTVRYVAQNSNTLLPTYFKFSAVWSAHEGSLLLWVLILSMWTAAVALLGSELPLQFLSRTLAILGLISVGFGFFLLFTSNPFERTFPLPPVDGQDLNPLLQDIALILHPPLLYFGYVGLAVPFAFAISALLESRFDSAWANWSRPWTIASWCFLTVGIFLGSWWAYYELGWGGWWFWDPVENASLMPWLVSTALIHSLIAAEQRGVFRSWTVLLAIFAFSLSLLGTFLVRSGVLTSVHAFASDPERGMYILLFLSIIVGSSLTLFAIRGPVLMATSSYSGASRETFLLINNLILTVAVAVVLLGTMYPLISDAFGLGKISVGPPYFNFFFVPLTFILLIFLPLAMRSSWGNVSVKILSSWLIKPLLLSLLVGLTGSSMLAYWVGDEQNSLTALVTLTCVSWVFTMIFVDFRDKLKSATFTTLPLRYYGMVLAHLGVAVTVLGAGLYAASGIQRDVKMGIGDYAYLGGYKFYFSDIKRDRMPNYSFTRAEIIVSRADREIVTLRPEKRHYFSNPQTMTEAAIDAVLLRDLYISLGEPLDNDHWAIRLHVKPFVRCIWLGGAMISLGGLLAVLDNRYRRRKMSSPRGLKNLPDQAALE
ncbi:MAG: heme lyase NrfEFG subunit NrfE [Porticoccaceae bacterium]|nr:heme lyase NrfEFG subunit NrfE [Porticoccaceae bacterium]